MRIEECTKNVSTSEQQPLTELAIKLATEAQENAKKIGIRSKSKM